MQHTGVKNAVSSEGRRWSCSPPQAGRVLAGWLGGGGGGGARRLPGSGTAAEGARRSWHQLLPRNEMIK